MSEKRDVQLKIMVTASEKERLQNTARFDLDFGAGDVSTWLRAVSFNRAKSVKIPKTEKKD